MVNPRPEIAAFLEDTHWTGAKITLLAGDASPRRYWRLTHAHETAVLMDAPPVTGETTEPFTTIARHLRGFGYSAPRIQKTDSATGLILMEDLGDTLFARDVVNAPQTEAMLYDAAVDLLADLAKRPIPDEVPSYDTETMVNRAGLASKWYAGSVQATDINDAVQAALRRIETFPTALALRDFHAENLLWLPDRDGLARVGLLDFQDAMRAPVGYDLISLLYDARRDVSAKLVDLAMLRFAQASDIPPADLRQACAILAAQRCLRILGVFARLSLHFGKPGYVDLIPRVWAQLEGCLAHPSLCDLAAACRANLPPPSKNHLNDLRARCGTIPTL
jgi:aminoglycoside/choline kinase family phosphotransferase